MPIREHFPEAGSIYLGGTSDGWEYTSVFSGSTLEDSYAMVKSFLKEEGFGEVPLPETTEDLLLFKHPRKNGQMALFALQGYAHNPVKICFHPDRRRKKALVLHLYNQESPQHLLRFYGIV